MGILLFIQMLSEAIFGGIVEAIGIIFFIACFASLLYAIGSIAVFVSQPATRKEVYKKNKYIKKFVDFLVKH